MGPLLFVPHGTAISMAKAAKEEVPADLSVEDWSKYINDKYGGQLVSKPQEFDTLKMRRFSSGSIDVDCAIGGGWPLSRIVLIAGDESTGKTFWALKAMNSIENYDHLTHLHKDFVKPEAFQRGRAMFVDVEGTFDEDWAKKLRVDLEWHYIARPEHQQQAIDIVSDSIKRNLFDLIILDSVAAMCPMEEQDASAEDNTVALAARKNNQAFRKWGADLNLMSQRTKSGGPCIILLNQMRISIGFTMGDPRFIPGGQMQKFAASIIVLTRAAEYDDTKTSALSQVKLKGTTKKNKTYPPRQNYETTLYLADTKEVAVGQLENVSPLMKRGKDLGLIQIGKQVTFGKTVTNTQGEFKALLASSAALQRQLWRSIINVTCGDCSI